MAQFAQELRDLRTVAGVTYRKMAAGCDFSVTTLAQAASGERLPSLPVALAYVTACGGEAEKWERHWREVSAAVTAVAESADDGARAPYRGLARFEPGDSDLFFGRDDLVRHVADRVARHRVVAVVGASGSGKSSLLRAGLIPALQGDGVGGQMLAALRILAPGPRPATAHASRMEPVPGAGETVVIVDQLEEVFTLATDPQERSAFLELIAAAAAEDSGLRVVVGIRADFFARCAQHAGLAAAMRDTAVVVGPMDAASLRQVIVRPAAAAGLIVERSLTARMIREAEAEPGSLPLLSHALLETWRRRRGRALTESMYEAAGGLHGAIATTAEASYGSLPAQGQAIARAILLRLIAPGDGGPDTRRPVPRHELGPDSPETAEVLDHLVRARLLTVDDDTVDLAHEALITAWPRYRGWIEQNRDRLRLHRALGDAAAAWAGLGHDAGALLRGNRLTAALEAFTAAGPGAPAPIPAAERTEFPDGIGRGELSDLEARFLQASRAALEREHRAQTRTARRMRALALALAVLLTLATIAAVTAVRQRTAADRARDRAVSAQQVALSRQLAADSATAAGTDPDLSALLAVQAYRTQPTVEAESALYTAAGGPLRLRLHGGLPVTGEAFSPDGRTLCWSEDGADVRCADTTTGSARTIPSLSRVTDLVFRDSRTLLTTDTSGAARATNLTTGRSRRLLAGTDMQKDAQLSADGRTQVMVDFPRDADVKDGVPYSNPDVTVRDLPTGRTRALIHVPIAPRTEALAADGHIRSDIGSALLAVSADGRLAATATGWVKETENTSRIRIWNTTTGRLQTTLRPGSTPLTATFSPDGRKLAAEAQDGGLRIWDTATATSTPVHAAAGRNGGPISALAFAPDGKALAAAFGGTLSLVDLTTGRNHTLYATTIKDATTATTPVTIRLAFSPDGRTVATADSMGELRLWDTATFRPYVSTAADTAWGPGVPLAALADDGRLLAVAQHDGSIRLVNTRTGKDLGALPSLGEPLSSLIASPRGPWLAVADDMQNTVFLWDLATRTKRALAFRGKIADAAVFSPDGSRFTADLVSTTQRDGWSARTWDTRTGRIVKNARSFSVFRAHPELGFSPDGKTFAVREDTRLNLLDARTGRTRYSWQTFPAIPTRRLHSPGFAFSPDSRTVASSGSDGYAQLLDTATGRVRSTMAAGTLPAAVFAFSPDGRSLAVGDSGGTVRVWDLPTARVRTTYDGLSFLTLLAFSPDGSVMAISDTDGRTQLWHTETPDPAHAIAQICRAVGRNLTEDELNRYLPHQSPARTCPP